MYAEELKRGKVHHQLGGGSWRPSPSPDAAPPESAPSVGPGGGREPRAHLPAPAPARLATGAAPSRTRRADAPPRTWRSPSPSGPAAASESHRPPAQRPRPPHSPPPPPPPPPPRSGSRHSQQNPARVQGPRRRQEAGRGRPAPPFGEEGQGAARGREQPGSRGTRAPSLPSLRLARRPLRSAPRLGLGRARRPAPPPLPTAPHRTPHAPRPSPATLCLPPARDRNVLLPPLRHRWPF
ncbi:proline-rich protein 2-like [Lutra lutra]|uniref:proline-rich protein 2-like n=1 Tax=Lutra lutra TaxID=9657 RepID=UPI001FD041BE|nr:proline-rich protein 2-like [Lutra lutra]